MPEERVCGIGTGFCIGRLARDDPGTSLDGFERLSEDEPDLCG